MTRVLDKSSCATIIPKPVMLYITKNEDDAQFLRSSRMKEILPNIIIKSIENPHDLRGYTAEKIYVDKKAEVSPAIIRDILLPCLDKAGHRNLL